MQNQPQQKTREQLMTELRTLIPALGVREAARQLGMSEDTALSWAHRYGWTAQPAVKAALERVPRPAPMQSHAINSEVLMANNLTDRALRTRLNHITTAMEVSDEIRQLPARHWLDKDNINILVGAGKHAALQCGYAADSRPDQPGKAFGARRDALIIDAEFETNSEEQDSTSTVRTESGQNESDA